MLTVLLTALPVAALDQGLLGHWPCDGNALDASGQGRHGTVLGATMTTDRFGRLNHALEFSELGHLLVIPGTEGLDFADGPFSLSLWVAPGTNDYSLVAAKHVSGFPNGFFLFLEENAPRWFVDDFPAAASAVRLKNTQWYHLVAVAEPARITLYVDGVPVGSETRGAAAANQAPFTIGGVVDGYNYTGRADDIRLYGRALESAEVRTLYQLEAAPPTRDDFEGSFRAWASGHGLVPGQDGPGDAPARDGVPNLAKFALGLDPRQPIARLPLTVDLVRTAGTPQIAVRYPLAVGATGIEFTFEVSTDLKSWEPARGRIEKLGDFSSLVAQMRFVEDAGLPHPARFLRARIGVRRLELDAPAGTVTQTLPSTGGTVRVDDPGRPLHGLTIDVPAGTDGEPQVFRLESRAIRSHPWGRWITPITPLIQVDNGGRYSAEPMTVTIPIELPPDHFALGFYHDGKRNTLEGMPLIGLSSNRITLATRHFSEFFVSMIPTADLPAEVDSGFRPGVDDWEFTNHGSFLKPFGHCAGQAISAMWYYVEKRRPGGEPLHQLLDNSQYWFRTPAYGNDNVLGYKLASRVQADLNWDAVDRYLQRTLQVTHRLTDAAFRYSLMMTREPQYVAVRSEAGGHALVVYAAGRQTLHVADPNYPGHTLRGIDWDEAGARFHPYVGGATAAETNRLFSDFCYVGKTAMVDWARLNQRWQELEAGTIARADFPGYTNLVVEGEPPQILGEVEGGEALYRTFSTTNEFVRIKHRVPDRWSRSFTEVFRPDGTAVGSYSQDLEYQRVDLEVGTNTLGFAVHIPTAGDTVWGWLGFNWILVVREPASPPAPTNCVLCCDWPIDFTGLRRVEGQNRHYHYEDVHGRWQGPAVNSFPDAGPVSSVFCYRDDRIHGTARHYRSDGSLALSEQYDAGLRQGSYQRYEPSGQLELEGRYQQNLPVGVWTQYQSDGSLLTRWTILDDMTVHCIEYGAFNQKTAEGHYRRDPDGPAPSLPEDFDVPFGRWAYYGPNGEIVAEEHFGP